MPLASTAQRQSVDLSLTKFVDYIVKSGIPRLTEVRNIKRQLEAGYKPHQDYYLKFRRLVRHVHSSGKPVGMIAPMAEECADASRKINYDHMARGYQRFWARHFHEREVSWVSPPRSNWQHGQLNVRVNPELAFVDGDEVRLIKLYLKKDKPQANQVEIILHLMQETLWPTVENPAISLLDVRRGRLYEATSFRPELTALLRGEALGFVEILKTLGAIQFDDDLE